MVKKDTSAERNADKDQLSVIQIEEKRTAL